MGSFKRSKVGDFPFRVFGFELYAPPLHSLSFLFIVVYAGIVVCFYLLFIIIPLSLPSLFPLSLFSLSPPLLLLLFSFPLPLSPSLPPGLTV